MDIFVLLVHNNTLKIEKTEFLTFFVEILLLFPAELWKATEVEVPQKLKKSMLTEEKVLRCFLDGSSLTQLQDA